MTSLAMTLPAATWVDRAAFPFRSIRVPVQDGVLHAVDHGEGPTVLLVHGTPTWSFEWRHVIADLSRDHRCVAPDHLGFGLSDRPAGAGYAPEDHARRLLELVRRLDLKDLTLVLHDLGGPIGLPLALEEPGRVKRLVVINSFAWPLGDDPQIRRPAKLLGGALGRLLYRYGNLSLRVILPSAYADRRRLDPATHAQYLVPFRDRDARVRVLWALARALLGSTPFYGSLWSRRAALRELPALLVWGERDPAFPPRLIERWREALPRAEVVVVPDAGHWPHEEQPRQVIAALRRFLGGGG